MASEKIGRTGQLKKQIGALSKQIIFLEEKTLSLIKREISLETGLVRVLERMVRIEENKVFDTKEMTKEREATLKNRVLKLQKKKEDYEKKKESIKHIRAKQGLIGDELAHLENRIRQETEELYGIKKTKNGAMKKGAKQKTEKKIKELKKKIKAQKKKIKKVKKIAIATEKLREKLKEKPKKSQEQPTVKKTKQKKPKLEKPIEEPKEEKIEEEKTVEKEEGAEEEFEWPKVKEEKPEEEFKEPEKEKPEEREEEEEKQGEEKEKEAEKPKLELEIHEFEEEKPKKQIVEKKFGALEEMGFQKKPKKKKIGKETGDLKALERGLERIGQKTRIPGSKEFEIESELMEPGFGPGKKILEYRDNEIALLYPNWSVTFGRGADSLVSVSKSDFSFEFTRNPSGGKDIQTYIAKETEKINSNPNAKVHISKQTGDNAYLEFAEEKDGRVFQTKLLYILYKKKVYKVSFSAPADEFERIEDIFLKTAFSVQTL